MPAVLDPALLAQVPLFAGLSQENLIRLAGLFHRKVLPAGAVAVSAEEPGQVVYIILKGCLKVFAEREDGAHVVLTILGPGQTLGEMSLIDNLGRSASATTLEESVLLWIDRSTFQQCIQTMPDVAANLLHIFTTRLRLANEQIMALAALEVEGRVARQILALARAYGKTGEDGSILIPVRLTQGDLAGMVGASRERVNQVIVAYKDRNYISVDQRHYFTIRNEEALARRCK
ncbi:MAG TPA: Crp/Fnr family transcriptional regulator [Blastocatellia bacterium]|jgi:CRP/FNR family cyclic AMP-dependent transcriptional regulator